MDFELYINWGVVGIIVLIALVIALLAANIKVVPQAHAFVIERLGALPRHVEHGPAFENSVYRPHCEEGLAERAGHRFPAAARYHEG